jgi:hypothetical protein
MSDELPVVVAEPLRVYAGDPRSFPIELEDAVDTPTDLTGMTLASQWRPHASSDTYVDLTIDATDLPNGSFSLSVPADASNAIAETSDLDVVRGVWDIAADNGVLPVTLLRGSLIVTRDVTRG